MRRAAFVVVGLLGCATAGGSAAPDKSSGAPVRSATLAGLVRPVGPAPAPAASKPPPRDEIVVIGKGPEKSPGISPTEQGTEFWVEGRQTFRCTKVAKTATNPRGLTNCRNISGGESRDPDPGREERAKVGSTPFK